MAVRIISCEKDRHGYHFRVHLDDEKPESAEWIREWTFGLPQPDLHRQHGKPMTEEVYLENVRQHLKEQVELELSVIHGSGDGRKVLEFDLD